MAEAWILARLKGSDGLGANPTDFFTPHDYTIVQPHDEDQRLSVIALRVDVPLGDAHSLSLVVQPYFTTTRYPLPPGVVAGTLARYVEANRLEALHVHDLPAVASALAIGRKRGIPVTFDMHENYPAAVGVWNRTAGARLFQTPTPTTSTWFPICTSAVFTRSIATPSGSTSAACWWLMPVKGMAISLGAMISSEKPMGPFIQ